MEDFRDEYIRKKIQDDKIISDKANNIFKDFEIKDVSNVHSKARIESIKDTTTYNKISFYKRMNKFLSVAAVFLCAIVVGSGAMLYNKKYLQNNSNTNITTNNVDYNYEGFKDGKEEVINGYENDLVRVSLIKNQEVYIQLKEKFLKLYNLSISADNQYKVNNITKNVKEVFVGCIVNEKSPYVFLLMDDGSIECVQILYDRVIPSGNYKFEFSSQGTIKDLYDVVGFEQQTRNFSYSADKYYYVNAIRKDGLKKEIELGVYNDWNDKSTRTYDMLNQQYIKNYNQESITDDGTNDKIEDNKIIYNLSIDNNYSYYIQNENFYRINKSTKQEECLAKGVTGVARDNEDGRLTVLLKNKYVINIVDKNIVYNEYNVDRVSNYVAGRGSDGVCLESRRDGSLILLLEIGTLERLGIKESETKLKENVRYNIYGEGYGVRNSNNNLVANVKTFEIDEVAPNSVLSIVYARTDDIIVCIDLKQAIKSSNLHLIKKVVNGAKNVEGFKTEVTYEEKNGEQVEKSRTLCTIERRENATFYNREINYDN